VLYVETIEETKVKQRGKKARRREEV